MSFIQRGRRGAGEETLGVILDGVIVFLQRVDGHQVGPRPAAFAHREKDLVPGRDWTGAALVIDAPPRMLDHGFTFMSFVHADYQTPVTGYGGYTRNSFHPHQGGAGVRPVSARNGFPGHLAVAFVKPPNSAFRVVAHLDKTQSL